MSLTTTTAGAQAKAADVDQFRSLLTGSMSDQIVTIANILKGTAVVATGLTGATAAGRWVGVTASGAPVSGTFVTGDWVTTQDGRIWVCTTGGTSGTWQQPSPPPDTNAADIAALGASAAAGSIGKSADAGHVHPWSGLGVLSVANTWTADQSFGTHLLGTLQTAAQPNVTSLGTLTSLALSGAISGVTTLTATTLAGTLSTAAQPNVTSLGTLSSLTVSGALNATLSTAAQPNVTSLGVIASLLTSGALTVDNPASNTGTIANALIFGSGSGEGIGSKRNAGGNQFGLDFYTNSTARARIASSGLFSILNGLVVTGAVTTDTGIALNGSGDPGAVGIHRSDPYIYVEGNGSILFRPNHGSSTGQDVIDTNGLLTLPNYNGSAWVSGSNQAVVGYFHPSPGRSEARQIFTSSTRDDTKAIEGDILVNG